MSFRSLRLPVLMAGAAAAVVLFAAPSFAWHARHSYRTTHHVVVHRIIYRPWPSYPWVPEEVMNVLGAVPNIIGGAGAVAGNILPYNCAYAYPSAPNPGVYCPPYGYYLGPR